MSTRGFTFVELMVAIVVLVVAILGILSAVMAMHNAAADINERNIAAKKLQTVTEIIHTVPYSQLGHVVPAGEVDYESLMDYDSSVPKSMTAVLPGPNGGDALISIIYTDENFIPISSNEIGNRNMVFVTAVISWLDRSGRQRSLTMTTVRSRQQQQ